MHPRVFANSHPENIAAIMGDGSGALTYRDLEYRANQGAHYFRSLGLQNRDAMALWMTNRTEFFEIYWAAQRSGLFIVPISTQFTIDDALYIINDSGAKLLICDPAVSAADHILEDEKESIADVIRLNLGDWSKTIAKFPITPISDELAGVQMVYSSGTTGRPKGVRITLPDMPATAAVPRAEALARQYGFDDKAVLLTPAPLYHAAPLIFSTMPQRAGSKIVLMPKFDAEQMLQWIEEYRVAFIQMVPTMFIRLLKLSEEARKQYDISSLKAVLHAAAPCPIEVKHAMLDWLGPIIYEYYAGSEGNGSTSIGPEEWLRKPGSVGKSDNGPIHICDESGHELPTGEAGLIYFEGGNEFAYYNDEKKTREARHPFHNGWTTMGDIGRVDEDSYLYLTDRKSFMIISGGVNIYPQEVENLLIQHPEVTDVAVIGIPHVEMGEEVKAVVQPVHWEAQGDELADRLISYCREKLSHFKCPKSIDFERQLPRHETGKLYKQEIRKKYWSGHA
ncbi:acyl-CoA synthetase [uncultured Parasphingorhabdus sp.]|uniref:acyl-CoA synthetase n=1 Tax=uncultured Parasphingorhabdus sp. TaxID=2709694 RepID=UPI002AA8D21C|nr:acyl-CoA synthetase [uncultured Parasphingorhabdus sp.]